MLQFPPEIEQKIKKLYPVMRQMKKENKRTKLVTSLNISNCSKHQWRDVYPTPGAHSQPRGTWGQNPTGTPNVENKQTP